MVQKNEGVDLRSLSAGTRVLVETRNSRYRLIVTDACECTALVEGGRYCRQQTEVQVLGSTLGGGLLSIGWIGLGWLLELSVHGKRILTSRVRSIRVEPTTV